MDNFNQQQNSKQSQGLAIASLVLGILSIILAITVIFPIISGILAIVFGILSLKRSAKGLSIAGIITGSCGLVLAIVIIIIGIMNIGTLSEYESSTSGSIVNDSNTSGSVNNNFDNSKSESLNEDEGLETFYGDGFELTYSSLLWTPDIIEMDGYDEGENVLKYVLDGSLFIPMGVSDMGDYSIATKAKCDEMYMSFYTQFEGDINENTYLIGGTETFAILKDNVYYASYCVHGIEDDELLNSVYVVASEDDDIMVSFFVQPGSFTKYGTDIPIIPLLQGITLTEVTKFIDSYEQKVEETDDEYIIGDESIPSLSQIMNDKSISYTYTNSEKTIGRIQVPEVMGLSLSDDLHSVEIIEVTYSDVDDVWGAVDAYGRLLNESYNFLVTYVPTEYPNYGEDYRFCELVRDPVSDDAGIVYVSAVYSRNENIIYMRFGTIGMSYAPSNGIGHIKLEEIQEN